MMNKKIGLMIVAVVAALSVVGAASAQQGQPPQPRAEGRDGGQEPILRQLLQIVAGDLGIAPGDIITQLQDQTLADVITANGGSVEEISAEITEALTERVNSAVADGTLTQERADTLLADLATKIDEAINGEFAGLRGELRGGLRGEMRPGLGGGRLGQFHDTRPLISAAVEATGLTAQEIGEALRTDGLTLSEVITANGGDPAAVVAAAVATVKTQLDEAVTNGRITQAQEDDMLIGLQAFYEAALGGAFRPAAAEAVDAAV